MDHLDPVFVTKLAVALTLFLFLPFTAISYFWFRHQRRKVEIRRVFDVLKIDNAYQDAYKEERPGRHFAGAVAYVSVIAGIGLALLGFSSDLKLGEFPVWKLRDVEFPQQGSWLICGMAFLGAYLWGLQHIYRRYTLNDLIPAAYYGLGLRMMLATVVALVLYNAAGAIGGTGSDTGGITPNIWPALALLIGMFPQRGLDWLIERVPIVARKTDPTVRPAPLEMIEGVTIDDRMRLQEVGIDTCYDLATADFVPLVLRTPYGARELADWILQAKLCACFGADIKELRAHNIRTVIDLARLAPKELEALAVETPLTRSSLRRAQEAIREDPEIEPLQEVGRLLGKFVGEARK